MGILGGLYLVDFTHQRLAGDAKPAAFGHVQSVTNQTLIEMAKKRIRKGSHGCMSLATTPVENVLRKHHELVTDLINSGTSLIKFSEEMKKKGVIFNPIMFNIMLQNGIYAKVFGQRGKYKNTGKVFTFPDMLALYTAKMEEYLSRQATRKKEAVEKTPALPVSVSSSEPAQDTVEGRIRIFPDTLSVQISSPNVRSIIDIQIAPGSPWYVKMSGKALKVSWHGNEEGMTFTADSWTVSS
jgi:hypothetical protein